MVSRLPTRDDLQPGTTVEVEPVEGHAGERCVGNVRVILTRARTYPKGIEVELDSGVVGHVRVVRTQES
jgi:uncharacterized repeat protein (TIGR03833 family)